MRHINIPVFIPHLGCPNQCIFCNQRLISGTYEFDEDVVCRTIDRVLSTASSDDECEIAFFGGSFTGIDRALMVRLLDLAQGYVASGKIVGIRMSTRPDYISEEIIEILKRYTVTFVELGIQTMNDSVLSYLKRGHSVRDTEKATELLVANGIKFVGQMMVGLPSATLEDEIGCAKRICELGASGARIYPTLVFRNTELEDITAHGLYSPLTLDEAVDRAAAVLSVFDSHGVECIRIGLCDSDNLHSDTSFVAGPNSPSIGEMVKSRVYFSKICVDIDKLDIVTDKKTLNIYCAKGYTSQIIGHRRKNVIDLKNKYGFSRVKVFEDCVLEDKTYRFEIKEENSCV